MNVVIPRRLLRRLKKLPSDLQRSVFAKLDVLAENPHDPELDIKPLAGKYAGYYRLRVGSVRLIYFVEKNDMVVSAIGFRGDVYK